MQVVLHVRLSRKREKAEMLVEIGEIKNAFIFTPQTTKKTPLNVAYRSP
jgi:hypothetical protein